MRLAFKRNLTGNVGLENYRMAVTVWDIHIYCRTKTKSNPASLIIPELRRETFKLVWEKKRKKKLREGRNFNIRFQKDFKWTEWMLPVESPS